MQAHRPNFPFSAVTGQTTFKLALVLVAINPDIGGVLVSGPRGSAKSTLARGLADVLPAVAGVTPSFVSLPLSVTEDMVVGTLDLDKVLNDKKTQFKNGLLAKADQGILYIDEVNLLQDHIVDSLLDVAASGVNVVERDGVSHSHNARFVLLGTMNPDEGELRPQLQDRFGLSVTLGHEYGIDERVEIVQRRETFDTDSQAFLEEYETQQTTLKNDILAARDILPTVECSPELRTEIAQRCHDAHVDGLRADIVWYRAARTHAALNGRLSVAEHDINSVEELVLGHRRKSNPQVPPKPPGSSSKPLHKPFSRPVSQERDAADKSESGSAAQTGSGDWGKMNPEPHKMAVDVDVNLPGLAELIAANKLNSLVYKGPSKASSQIASRRKSNSSEDLHTVATGRAASLGQNESRKVNWVSSLLNSAGQWPLRQLRFSQLRKKQTVLHFLLIDTSASTLSNDLFSQAKAIILKIAKQAYLDREQLAIVGFGNQQVDVLLTRQRAPKELKRFLDSVWAAGGTPFREALMHAERFQRQQYRQTPNICIKTVIITDGKTRQPLVDISLKGEIMLIDIEQSPVKRGKGLGIANDLNAAYIPLFSQLNRIR